MKLFSIQKINNATRKENPWDDTIFLSKITSDVVKTDAGIYIYSLYSCVREGIIMKEHEQAILYLCDGKKCEQCDPDFCSHTTDINHAKNFIKSWGDFIEVESKENS